jgi:hypothetical protein
MKIRGLFVFLICRESTNASSWTVIHTCIKKGFVQRLSNNEETESGALVHLNQKSAQVANQSEPNML